MSLCLTSRGSKVKNRECKVGGRKVEMVDELNGGARSVTFGGATASESMGELA